jgi:hypothetical protein
LSLAWSLRPSRGGRVAGRGGALIFSKETADLLFGIRHLSVVAGALPETLVWDRQAGPHAGDGRPTEAIAAFRGQPAGRLGRRRLAARDVTRVTERGGPRGGSQVGHAD